MQYYNAVKDDIYHRFHGIAYAPLQALAFEHTAHVDAFSQLLARKRGLNVEQAALAALLHDSTRFIYNQPRKHAQNAALFVKDYLKDFINDQELIEAVSAAIETHSDKRSIGNPYQEVLKDADVLAHLIEGEEIRPKEEKRLENLLQELAIL